MNTCKSTVVGGAGAKLAKHTRNIENHVLSRLGLKSICEEDSSDEEEFVPVILSGRSMNVISSNFKDFDWMMRCLYKNSLGLKSKVKRVKKHVQENQAKHKRLGKVASNKGEGVQSKATTKDFDEKSYAEYEEEDGTTIICNIALPGWQSDSDVSKVIAESEGD